MNLEYFPAGKNGYVTKTRSSFKCFVSLGSMTYHRDNFTPLAEGLSGHVPFITILHVFKAKFVHVKYSNESEINGVKEYTVPYPLFVVTKYCDKNIT